MPRARSAQPSQSVRVVWAFLRYLAAHPKGQSLLGGIRADAKLVDPHLRIPLHEAALMLEDTIRLTGDPAIGLHAATHFEPGDRDLVESAARSCKTLRAALECTIRYIRLLSDEATFTLRCTEDEAVLERHSVARGALLQVSSDFALLDIVQFLRRNCAIAESEYTIEFAHAAPDYAAEYGQLCSCMVRFGAGRNALVFRLDQLDLPMKAQCAALAEGFARRADEELARLTEAETVTYRVRRFVAEHLPSGQLSMAWAARSLGLSQPTLRRHLEAEGTTFSRIIEDVRREVAARELGGGRSVSEVALILGFSTTSAFARAFKRWHAMQPTEYRGRNEESQLS
ncbi:MAG: AraC family transcriptional regulator ligand-binding domain-containing protein [Polyangiaceae bacterium]